ncbi:DUF2288 domain-containing protein [Gilvimarinus polysaccharolyticus]|uniref:DUF2288 domain-containing protein n=1 Tax=Gilvimarinus polysaccharolyticus TaxID=863921 RepID=UPI00067381C0|nr:DUF2288 domain-containing protein [Gilvimarinus polysaccharolyticus]
MTDDNLLKAKVNLETAQIPWHELQRFFASGAAIYVAPGLDLTAVATAMADDNAAQIEQWMRADQVQPVTDAQAKQWFDTNTTVWAVVIKPWVVVQEKSPTNV